MKIRKFAFEDYPAIVAIHNSQNIVWPEWPRTPEAWKEADHHRSPRSIFQRWVAVEAGRVVGFSSYEQNPWSFPPQSFSIHVEVQPGYQCLGIGSALYDQLMQSLQVYSPPALRADSFTNLPQGFTFLRKRGFREVFRETPVHLDVSTFDPGPYERLEEELKGEGILIKTLPELGSDPDRNRKLYDLYWEITEDAPHEGQQTEYPDFDEWVSWGLHDSSVLQDAYFIAVDGEKYIGLRELGTYLDGDVLLGSLLGVRREYRRRNIGLALQLRGIAYAREHGFRLLKTCTAVQNAPMQALFCKLGYRRDPEWQQCQKDLH